ncbi:pimeloyl-ACP methyl ester carboxylesterase [Kitasatospora sp. MAP12-15]|uniref:alpha/beta fold hydrolase n=1 Tax=unclassified Kitasatospora TaxID=2633591 RepID=UPI002476A913|nr:alpha/beta hydrolase [Kitasatospora sp. MAP12-44]MDH6111186.1 pimeloyl-ACP methyl ester carboxylesterase [Kitasatospora sp. MAP12-44]
MTIHHRLLGNGEHPVVVLHDWFGTSAGWGPFLDLLDGSAFSYAFLDYRGYGDRAEVPGEYTLAEIAEDVLALADQLGWPTFSLVGHSMGGKAAQRVLAQAPHRVRKLAGIAPVPASAFPLEGDAFELFHGAAAQPANRRAILDMVTGHRAGAVWLDRMTTQSLALSRPEAFAAYLTDWSTQDFAAKIDGAELPVRVFACEHDEALTPEVLRATWLPHYPQAELTVLPATGHYPMYETPVAFAAALEAFLR